MNFSLTPELEQLVNDKVKSGMYQSASEVIREGLRLLTERDGHLAQLRAEIRAGFDDVERGEYDEYDEHTTKQLAEDIKSRGRRRIAELNIQTGTR